MATGSTISRDDADAWRTPWWLPARSSNDVNAGWNEPADEFVVRFAETERLRAVVVPIAGQPNEDVSLLVDERTGEIAGVQVLPLGASVAARFLAWRACAAPTPPAAVAALVAEVHALFDRHGVDGDDPAAP